MEDMERGGPLPGILRERYRRFWRRASLAFRDPFGEPVELLTEYEGKALRMDIPLYGGSVGQPGVGPSTGDLEKRMKGLWRCGVCLWELCEGNLEGGLPCWGP